MFILDACLCFKISCVCLASLPECFVTFLIYGKGLCDASPSNLPHSETHTTHTLVSYFVDPPLHPQKTGIFIRHAQPVAQHSAHVHTHTQVIRLLSASISSNMCVAVDLGVLPHRDSKTKLFDFLPDHIAGGRAVVRQPRGRQASLPASRAATPSLTTASSCLLFFA